LSGNTDYPYSLKEEDFVHVPIVSLPELNMSMPSVLIPIEKVLNGDYLYLYSPCEFYDARINKDDLLFIQKTRSA